MNAPRALKGKWFSFRSLIETVQGCVFYLNLHGMQNYGFSNQMFQLLPRDVTGCVRLAALCLGLLAEFKDLC